MVACKYGWYSARSLHVERRYSIHAYCEKQYLHLIPSLNRDGRWSTPDDFTTSFLHFPLLPTALWNLANSRPVHSLMLSSHLFLCLPCLFPPFTVPCKMVLARPDERKTCAYHFRLHWKKSFHCVLQDGFGQTWWTGVIFLLLMFALGFMDLKYTCESTEHKTRRFDEQSHSTWSLTSCHEALLVQLIVLVMRGKEIWCSRRQQQ